MSKRGKHKKRDFELLDDPEDVIEDLVESPYMWAGCLVGLVMVGLVGLGLAVALYDNLGDWLDSTPDQHRLRVIAHGWTHEITIERYTEAGEWVYDDSTIERGTARDDELGWQDPNLTPCPDDALATDCLRVGEQIATYRLTLQAPAGEQIICAVERDMWQETPLQSIFRAEVGRECTTLEPQLRE